VEQQILAGVVAVEDLTILQRILGLAVQVALA
jgi:hypothetical protein